MERLADDHENARHLAASLAEIPGIEVETPQTNLVYFDPTPAGMTPSALVGRLRQHGVLLSILGSRIRACTHLDVDQTMIEEVVGLIDAELSAA